MGHYRSGVHYRAAMQNDISNKDQLEKHSPKDGQTHVSRQGNAVSAAGWHVPMDGVWSHHQEDETSGRCVARGHHTLINVANYHARPDQASNKDHTSVILQSMMRLCYREQIMIFTGDFNPVGPSLKK